MLQDKVYFRNLNSIRFIAALMVYLGHALRPAFDYLPVKGSFLEDVLNTISNGEVGVSLFFVLSGFLITYLLMKEKETKGKIFLKDFYMRRVLRIWPLYFAVIAFSFLLYPLLKSMLGINVPLCSNIWYYLSFLSNFDVIHIEKFCHESSALMQSITWSVSIEEQFYLFWPLIFVFLPQKYWIGAIALSISGSLLFRLIHHHDEVVLCFHTFSVLLDLAIGGTMAYLIRQKKSIRTFFEGCGTVAHLFLFLLSFLLVMYEHRIFSFEYGNAIGRIFISLTFGMMIAAQAFSKKDGPLNLENLRFADRWGKYTYGIYLLHPIAIMVVDVAVRYLNISKLSFIVLAGMGLAGFILTLMMSKLSYDYYESYFLKLKEKFNV